jgi:hypothetical protein
MSTRTLHRTIDSEVVSPAGAIELAAQTGPLLVLTGRALNDLADELGSDEAAMRHLLRVAETVNKPIAVNVETGPDTSSTVFLAPRSWTPERLRGWAAGHHEALEATFGAATFRE